MNLTKEVVEIQLDLLLNFTRSLAYYRAIQQDLELIGKNRSFWEYNMNAHYLRAITDWCIVFGADNNEAHWKKVSDGDGKKIMSEIRHLITSSDNIKKNEWDVYHKKVIDFRNEYASHRNISFSNNVPSLSKAYEVSNLYFDWLKEWLRPSTNEPKPLKDYFSEFQIEILEVLVNDLKK